MKKNIGYLVILSLAVLLNACAPAYKCGDAKPEKTPWTWSKNMKAVVSERDVLCDSLAAKNQQNKALKVDLADLDGKHKTLAANYLDLQNKFKNLSGESLAISEELDAKGKLLSEREKSINEMMQVIARQDSITKRLNAVLRSALLGFNSDELSVEVRNGKVYVSMSDKLLFKSGSSAVEAKGKEALKLLGGVLDKNPDIDILVEGHTDNVPIKTSVYKDNWDLSVARATSIVRILVTDYRIAPTRMTASGKGEFFPKATNDTPEGRAINRRTEIILSPKLNEIMQLLNN
jgi:chemotaxis protein MotB